MNVEFNPQDDDQLVDLVGDKSNKEGYRLSRQAAEILEVDVKPIKKTKGAADPKRELGYVLKRLLDPNFGKSYVEKEK